MEILEKIELIEIKGGGTTETFVDSEGWEWTYHYDDNGNLLAYSVAKVMCAY